MRILHTSDWHIGRTLYGRKRYEEFEAFLDWLVITIQEQAIDTLLVAGDIFDTSTPSNRSQELYYRFLYRIAISSCRHVVIIAGNHDSPSFLNAPRALLTALDIHVVGNITSSPEEEVLLLRDGDGVPELLVCAVPYLRDRDIRTVEVGESIGDKERKLLEGVQSHYAAVAAIAERKRVVCGWNIPIIGMGHLFTKGGQTVVDDGVRELYVGSLAHIASSSLPSFTYWALGHLHMPQKVGGLETMRYSGSPLPMGFGEAGQRKSVCMLTLERGTANPEIAVSLLPVPVFQKLESVRGDWSSITARIQMLAAEDSSCWLEIVYDADELMGDLRERLEKLLAHTRMEILRIKNIRSIDRALQQLHHEETLDALDAADVFMRCLDAYQVPEEQRPELLQTYRETLVSLQEDDCQAEKERRS